jgi:biopolymer transport protein ExbD
MNAGPNIFDDDVTEPIITDINVTPMVDIMLVLLIIFMVTARFILAGTTPVQVPGEGTTPGPSEIVDIVVVVTAAGEIQYEREAVTIERLQQVLDQTHQNNPHARLLIVADRQAFYGNVMQVLDLGKSLGFEDLSLAKRGGE